MCSQGGCQGAGGGEDIAPGVVGVGYYPCAAGIGDAGDIALDVGDVIVGCSVVGYGKRLPGCVIGEVQNCGTAGLLVGNGLPVRLLPL